MTFDNIDPVAIVRSLGSLNLGQNIVRFIELLLKLRITTSTVGISNCHRIVCRGTSLFDKTEGLRPFVLLALSSPPPQKPCSQSSTGFLLCFSLSRRLSLMRFLLPRKHIVPSGHSTILEVDPVAL